MFLTYKLNTLDLEKIKKYLLIFIEFLFSTGAVEIYLPLKKNYKINKNLDRVKFIEENVIEKILKWFQCMACHQLKWVKIDQIIRYLT